MRHGHRLFAGIGLLLLTAPAGMAQPAPEPVTRPATEPATRPAAEQRQIEQHIALSQAFANEKLAGLEAVPGVPASEVIHAGVEEGRVVIAAHPDVPAGQYKLPLPGGDAALQLRKRGSETWLSVLLPEVPTPESFEPGSDGLTGGFLQYDTAPALGRILITRNAEFVDGSLSVSVTQTPPEQQSQPYEPGVRLHVVFAPNEQSALAGFEPRPAVRIEASAESFADLRREHREAFDTHVLPMMRRLGLGAIIEEEVRTTARQLFLDKLPVTDEQRAATLEALAQLDSPAFPERRAAQLALEKLGRPAATVLATVPSEELTAEQQARVELLLGDYRTLPADEAERLANDPDFLRSVASLSGDEEADLLAAAAQERLEALQP